MSGTREYRSDNTTYSRKKGEETSDPTTELLSLRPMNPKVK